MRAISIWQPFPALFIIGAKEYETRSWYTSYRGPIALHAAKKSIKEVMRLVSPETQQLMRETIIETQLEDLPLGAIVATAEFVACHKITPAFVRQLSPYELEFGDFSFGRYAWEFQNVRALHEPIQAVGKQGFWEWIPPQINR